MDASVITLLSASEPGKVIALGADLPWDLMLQWLSLLVVIWLLYKMLFKPVSAFLDKRKETIARNIEEAKSQKSSAFQLRTDYEARLEGAKEEAVQILKDTRTKALLREEEMIKVAKNEAERIRQKAFDEIQLEQERAKDDMKKEIVELSALIAGKVIGTSLDAEKHKELIDQIIKEMGTIQWQV